MDDARTKKTKTTKLILLDSLLQERDVKMAVPAPGGPD